MLNKVALGVGLVLGFLAVLMVNLHVSDIKQTQEAVKVVRVVELVRKGEPPGSRLAVVKVPEDFSKGLETAVTEQDLALVRQRPVNSDLKEGTFLQWSHFEGGGRTTERAIMEVLGAGRRAMALPVSASGSVAGWIRPGDFVDVVGTFSTADRDGNQKVTTMTIRQNMKVLAVGGKTDYAEEVMRGRSSAQKGSDSIVVEVTPHEAEILTFALSQGGALTLVLRRPDDHAVTDIPRVNWDNFAPMATAPSR